jgi:hypothetical protein
MDQATQTATCRWPRRSWPPCSAGDCDRPGEGDCYEAALAPRRPGRRRHHRPGSVRLTSPWPVLPRQTSPAKTNEGGWSWGACGARGYPGQVSMRCGRCGRSARAVVSTGGGLLIAACACAYVRMESGTVRTHRSLDLAPLATSAVIDLQLPTGAAFSCSCSADMASLNASS